MALVEYGDITAIGFTGSDRGGKVLFDEANKRPALIPGSDAGNGEHKSLFILPDALKREKKKFSGPCRSRFFGVDNFVRIEVWSIPKSKDGSNFKRLLLQISKG